jgi:hypothetical protein
MEWQHEHAMTEYASEVCQPSEKISATYSGTAPFHNRWSSLIACSAPTSRQVVRDVAEGRS